MLVIVKDSCNSFHYPNSFKLNRFPDEFRLQGGGGGVEGVGLRCRVQGAGFRVEGVGLKVQG